MDPLPHFWALIIALILALVVFGGLVLLGVRILRFLGLAVSEGDLPLELKYEPPPPPVRDVPDGEAARATAAVQQQRWTAYRTARQVLDEALAVHAKVVDPAAHPELKPALAEAEAAADAAEGAMRHEDPQQALALVQIQLARVRAAAANVDGVLKA